MRARQPIRPQRAELLALRAHGMRQAPSLPEEALWRVLRAGKAGVVFRRQVVLGGRFIVDFVAPAARLVVEVDGRHHERRRAADARRDRVLGQLGYRVLRLEAELVMRNPAEAVERVRQALSGLPGCDSVGRSQPKYLSARK